LRLILPQEVAVETESRVLGDKNPRSDIKFQEA